ncbi:MAG: metallophosphoesterase family protein [Sarcina sp.]
MSKYIMSDLHGCYDKFLAMLKKINFTEEDELYILGDIFDRGDKPLEVLEYIRSHKNITLLKGNHEKMFEDYYETRDNLWFYNGGNTTYEELMQKDEDYMRSTYNYIKNLPVMQILKEEKLILVHAGVYYPSFWVRLEMFVEMQEEDICIWDRSNIGKNYQYEDYKVVCGHTPVQTINGGNSIIRTDVAIYMDCGAVFEGGRLACIRIEDMEEYYV